MTTKKQGIRIVDYLDMIDLRTVVSKTGYLKQQSNRYKLRHMDAVLFTNVAQTRFRMILNIHSTIFLCAPEIDEKSKISLYLRISEVLTRLTGVRRVEVKLDEFKSDLKEKAKRLRSIQRKRK